MQIKQTSKWFKSLTCCALVEKKIKLKRLENG